MFISLGHCLHLAMIFKEFKVFFVIFFFNIYLVNYITALLFNERQSKVWGPGLNPVKIISPARYFFVQLVDDNAKKIKNQLKDPFKVRINGHSIKRHQCRVWTNILDKKDGSFIVRYKLYEICYDFEIEILTSRNTHVGGSPYKFQDPVYPDECFCPISSVPQWLKDNECNSEYAQVLKDLQSFKNVNLDEIHKVVVKKFENSRSASICNYVVLNNQIYRKCYGEHVGFKMFMDAILLSLSRKVSLPDIELFVNLGDWPLSNKNTPIPLFSWCGSNSTQDIVMPTYDLTESVLENMGRVSLDMLSVQGNIDLKWESKIPKAFWRGRDSSKERLKLIKIARAHPQLFNASLTNFFFFRDLERQYGPKDKLVSFFKFFDYKYQINMDGTVAAYRFPYLLAGDSLVFKQDSEYYEHFYSDLKPWKHYIPFNSDLSNLVERIKWAIDHDKEAKRIAVGGQTFARNNLMPQDIFCYHVYLLNEWSKRIGSDIKLRDGMEPVIQPSHNIDCNDCEGVFDVVKDEL
ncbi:unnamed protein product [Bemisia tabaci]|uniref:Glycosyl transferase CAP10 domain-containing protein n=1 Tax=Bemisia tabaci TaxID=7038 RepID=A0A9P0A7J8_BEMTA|nr:unnamed protein product [Bemisia tabaci]